MNSELWEQCNKALYDKITEVSKEYFIVKSRYRSMINATAQDKIDIFLEDNFLENLVDLLDRQNLIIVELQRGMKYLTDELSFKKRIVENKENIACQINEKMINKFLDKMFRQEILITELQNELRSRQIQGKGISSSKSSSNIRAQASSIAKATVGKNTEENKELSLSPTRNIQNEEDWSPSFGQKNCPEIENTNSQIILDKESELIQQQKFQVKDGALNLCSPNKNSCDPFADDQAQIHLHLHVSNSPINQTMQDPKNDKSNAYNNNSINYSIISSSINTTIAPTDSIKDALNSSSQFHTAKFPNKERESQSEKERKNSNQNRKNEMEKKTVYTRITQRKTKDLPHHVTKNNVANQGKLSLNTSHCSDTGDRKVRNKISTPERKMQSQFSNSVLDTSGLLNNHSDSINNISLRAPSQNDTISSKPTSTNMTQRILKKYYQILEKYNNKAGNLGKERNSGCISTTRKTTVEEKEINKKRLLKSSLEPKENRALNKTDQDPSLIRKI